MMSEPLSYVGKTLSMTCVRRSVNKNRAAQADAELP